MELIKRVFDKYFAFMDEIDGNSLPEVLIPKEMLNLKKESKYDGIRYWKTINSTVSENQIQRLENYYGSRLPISYKRFLHYKHFIELQLGHNSINFFKNLPKTVVEDTIEEIESYYNSLISRNYLPFARVSDYGVLCFDANGVNINQKYKIVSFDHEDYYSQHNFYSLNFESMFAEFEINLDDWIKTKRKKVFN